MVSFRFHLVSLIAVFLALALGIGMGVTVIDKATVDLLQRRLDSVHNEVQAANQRSDDMARSASRSADFENQAEDYLINRQVAGVPVVGVGFRGIDEGPYNDLIHLVQRAGGVVAGTLWFTTKSSLDDSQSALVLQKDLGVPSADVTQLHAALLARVSAVLSGGTDAQALRLVVNDDFVEWQAEPGQQGDIGKISFGPARLILASGFAAESSSNTLDVQLAKLLGAEPVRRVVAVESGRDPDAHTSGERAVFLDQLRSYAPLNAKLSTVDDIELAQGRDAAVLALAQLTTGRTGNFGLAASAEGPIPKLAP